MIQLSVEAFFRRAAEPRSHLIVFAHVIQLSDLANHAFIMP